MPSFFSLRFDLVMDGIQPLAPVIPVFLLIAIGFFFACWKKTTLGPLTEIMVYLGAPCLAFTSLTTKPLFAADIAVILVDALGIMGGKVGLLIWLYAVIFRFRSPGFSLPVLFYECREYGYPAGSFCLRRAWPAAGHAFLCYHGFSLVFP